MMALTKIAAARWQIAMIMMMMVMTMTMLRKRMTMTKIVEVGCRPQVAIPSHFPQRTDYPLYSMSLSEHASRTHIQMQVQTQIRTTSLLYDFTSTFLDNTNTNAIMPPPSITARVQSQRIQEDARHQLRSIKCAFTYEATIIPILTIPCLCGMDTVRLLMLCLQQENEAGATRHKIYERMAESFFSSEMYWMLCTRSMQKWQQWM